MVPLAARPRLLLVLCALGLHLTLGKKDAATIAREEIVERTLAEVCGDSTDLGCTGISRMQYKVNDASATPASRAKTLEEIEATLARFEADFTKFEKGLKTEWDAADEDVKATRKVAKPKLRMLHVMKVQEEEKAGKKAAKKTVKPNADWKRNWNLVDGNFNETIKGTAAFIFFYRETCGACTELMPDWKSLATEYADSDTVLIGGAECGGMEHERSELCKRFGIRSTPAFMTFLPPDDDGEVHRGERDIYSWREVVKSRLEWPGCSPEDTSKCNLEQAAQLEKYMAMSAAQRDTEAAALKQSMEEGEAKLDALVDELNNQWTERNKLRENMQNMNSPRRIILKRMLEYDVKAMEEGDADKEEL